MFSSGYQFVVIAGGALGNGPNFLDNVFLYNPLTQETGNSFNKFKLILKNTWTNAVDS